VRLRYADVDHDLVPDPETAVTHAGEGTEVIANYTAFRGLTQLNAQ
jgi:hypothetical protein